MKKGKYLFALISLCAVFISMNSFSYATKDIQIGEGIGGTENFETQGKAWDMGEISPDTKITVCDWGSCKKVKEMTFDHYLDGALVGMTTQGRLKAKEEIYRSQYVYTLTNKTLGNNLKPKRLVFYRRDKTKKTQGKFMDKNNVPANQFLAKNWEKMKKNRPDFISGRTPTTILWSEMALTPIKGGICQIKNGKVPKDYAKLGYVVDPDDPTLCCNPKEHPTQCKKQDISTTPDGDPELVLNPTDDSWKHETLACDVGSGPVYTFDTTKDAGEETIDGVYSVYVQLIPVRPVGLSSLPADQQAYWEKTHKKQVIGPFLTEYGKYLVRNGDQGRKFLDSAYGESTNGVKGASSNYRASWNNFAAGAKAAIAKGVPVLDIEMSEENREGFGRGGAFTFVEMRKNATVHAEHSQDYYTKHKCKRYKGKTCSGSGANKTCDYYDYTAYEEASSGHIKDGQYGKIKSQIVVATNYYPYMSYQEINVRCNKQGFDNLVASTHSTVQTYGSGIGSATAKSPVVNMGIATFYNHLGVDFFYNNDGCKPVFGCTGAPNVGASNDSTNNKQNTGDLVNGKFGAQSDNKTGSEFFVFRNNVTKLIRNDVWHLSDRNVGLEWKDTGWDTKDEATATFMTMDKKGTPSTEGDFFYLEKDNGEIILKGTELPTKNYELFLYQENVFGWRSSWASKKANPHRMNLRYAYRPETKNETIEKINRNGIIPAAEKDHYVLDMACDVEFNTTDVTDPIIKNQPKQEEYKAIKDFNDIPRKYLSTTFVKSSAE